jgi:hypothetical protein
MPAEQCFSRPAKELDITATGRTAAVAINRRGAGLALTVGAAILLALVRWTGATGVRAFFILVSHFSILLLVVGVCRSVAEAILAANPPAAHALIAA